MTDCGLGANYEYDNNGALIKTECDNGLTTTYTRDSRGRLESLRAGFAGETALLDAKYTYDGNGNRTSRNEKFFMQNDRTPTSAVTQYAYDSMNRLTMENRNGLATSYTYDMAGNRTGRLKGDDKEEYRYNSRNQLTELTGMGRRTSYQYDPAGNLTQEQRFIQERAETRRYVYDAYNRNTEVRGEDFLHKNFYDAEGLRNRIEENGKATDFVYSGDMLYSEREVNSTRERRYILGNEYLGHEDTVQDVTFSGENQKQEYSYITDEQGSLRYILNADRQTETYQEYSAFGERIFQEGASSRLGYNSQMGDELTGLTYLRARYYNPATGRFTQEDVIYDDGFNLYAYCGSNPVIYCDPSGFEKENPLVNCNKTGGECSGDLNLDELIKQVPDMYKKNFKCVEFTEEMEKLMKKYGISGERIFIQSGTGIIWSDAFGVISENGKHYAIKVGDTIFDNLNSTGVNYKKWLKDLGILENPSMFVIDSKKIK